jgi:Carboxypeptidase regulatory-like domain
MKNLKLFLLTSLFTLFINSIAFGQSTGSVAGQVYDSLGAVVVGANVIAVDAAKKEKATVTNGQGAFTIGGLAPGKYTIRVVAAKFALYENTEVEVKAGQREELTVALSVEEVQANVDVQVDSGISTDSDTNKSATVLKEDDLDALPDDPNELEAALQALAGPSAGPNGGQIYIDGFTGGRIPPKEAIREIRINQNPFSAEYERLGFGRIEILTKPGSDKWRGQAFFNFNDESLNSRNPFAANRASSQTRFYGGNISGPVKKGKSSFFLDVSNREIDNVGIVNALVIDPSFNIVPFSEEFTIPNRRFSISPRFDYQLNDANTLIARYSFTRFTTENQGIGDLSLPSRGYATETTEHNIRLTETWIVNPKTVNETRFQYEFDNRQQTGDNTVPTVSVASAFVGGGAQIGLNYNRQNSWELQNYTTTAFGKKNEHSVKFGVRLRNIILKDRSESNFGGTFAFSGFFDAGDPNNPNDDVFVTPIEQYRQKLLGNPDPRYNPAQFGITTGNPLADVSQFDVGAFISDDWRISPALTLGFGLRYENQTNIDSNFNFAPRFSFAWSPGAGGAKQPKTVFRGGIGIFYDRFNENFTLQSNRFDGSQQLQFNISANETDPLRRAAALTLLAQPVFTLNGVSNIPTVAQIAAAVPFTSTIRRVSEDLQAPYTIQAALGLERQLPFKTTMAVFYIGSRTSNLLRTRNVNAPICPAQINCSGSLRPFPTLGNIYEYESTGVLNQHQVIFNFRTAISNKINLFGNYRLAFAKSDSDGANSFPAYSYDLSNEYGTSSLDIRHNAFVGGSFTLPWAVRLNPFVIFRSGVPFNITTGTDSNGDLLFTERPTFAQLNTRCNQLGLTNSFCDISNVADPNATIPRNYGRGPSFFSFNLGLSRTFGFGGERNVATTTTNPTTQGGVQNPVGGNRRGGGGANRGGGNRGGGGGGLGGGGTDSPYNLTVGVQISNLFNNVNLNTPVGNLISSRFGQSTSTAGGFGFGGGGGNSGNRRVELQVRFNW